MGRTLAVLKTGDLAVGAGLDLPAQISKMYVPTRYGDEVADYLWVRISVYSVNAVLQTYARQVGFDNANANSLAASGSPTVKGVFVEESTYDALFEDISSDTALPDDTGGADWSTQDYALAHFLAIDSSINQLATGTERHDWYKCRPIADANYPAHACHPPQGVTIVIDNAAATSGTVQVEVHCMVYE